MVACRPFDLELALKSSWRIFNLDTGHRGTKCQDKTINDHGYSWHLPASICEGYLAKTGEKKHHYLNTVPLNMVIHVRGLTCSRSYMFEVLHIQGLTGSRSYLFEVLCVQGLTCSRSYVLRSIVFEVFKVLFVQSFMCSRSYMFKV